MRPPDDIRLFREFYPDADERHAVHRAFAHSFIAPYVFQNPHAFFGYLFFKDMPFSSPTEFLHTRWQEIFERNLQIRPKTDGTGAFRRVKDLTLSLHTVNGRPCALIAMPEPERSPEAHFIGVVLMTTEPDPAAWSRDVQARVFTLEKTVFPPPHIAMACEWAIAENHQSHINHGVFSEPRAADFLGVIENILGKEAPLLPPATPPSLPPLLPPPLPPSGVPSYVIAPLAGRAIEALPEQPLEEILAKPESWVEHVFEEKDYIPNFGREIFRRTLLLKGFALATAIRLVREGPDRAVLKAGDKVCWVVDFDSRLRNGMNGKAEFIERVKHAGGRPHADFESLAAELHILAKGVVRIQVKKKSFFMRWVRPGEPKTIGWYVGELKSPRNGT